MDHIPTNEHGLQYRYTVTDGVQPKNLGSGKPELRNSAPLQNRTQHLEDDTTLSFIEMRTHIGKKEVPREITTESKGRLTGSCDN